ncbi:uncharacterized protein Dwil_GK11681 [Drosophila willistoni]|uniref:Tetratricopeptide repeat protein 12 n=1 Tax=Drosophila willistoni TaxID=7260 RepID=B4NA85_DROWI|nr:uncharacterized protein LOC6647363 [Drosophila willistoni]EDW80728.2 uncharacterized protein Dwil_GK11681 [Drosophila willistoni]
MEDPEDFLFGPSEVMSFMKQLEDIIAANKSDNTKEKDVKTPEVDITAGVTEDNFIVIRRMPKGKKSYGASKSVSRRTHKPVNVNQMSFMRQVDVTKKQRQQAFEERHRVAENFRRLGNDDFRKNNYERAILMYTKGLSYINDTPVLYCNRALAFVKKREYNLALLDLDYVLHKLNPKCMKAWLYRAGTMKRMNNETGFESAINMARKYQRTEKDTAYLQMFLEKVRSDF